MVPFRHGSSFRSAGLKIRRRMFFCIGKGPLRIPAGGAAAAATASSACRPWSAPFSANMTDTALCPAAGNGKQSTKP